MVPVIGMADYKRGLWRKVYPVEDDQYLVYSVLSKAAPDPTPENSQRLDAFQADENKSSPNSYIFPWRIKSPQNESIDKATKEGQRISSLRSRKLRSWQEPFST